MTNDVRDEGWRYAMRTDRNRRRRRQPEVAARVRAFRKNSLARGAPRCASRARTPHGGPLQAHHVGGLGSKRLRWLCERHNQQDAGHRPRAKPRRSTRRRRSRPKGLWDLLFG